VLELALVVLVEILGGVAPIVEAEVEEEGGEIEDGEEEVEEVGSKNLR